MDLPKPPPFFVGAVILFWGWQTDYLMFAVPMAILIESVSWVKWRWDFSDDEFNLLVDLTAILWMGAGLYFWLDSSFGFVLSLIAALPMLSWILLAAQHYSKQQNIPLSSLMYTRRQRRKKAELANPDTPVERVDITYPFALLALMSTSMGRQPGMWPELFFLGLTLLCGWSLWQLRSGRFNRVVWLSVMLAVMGTSWVGHLGWQYVQRQAEHAFLNWLDQQFWNNRDPFRQTTSIGAIGKLKDSNQILFRVKSDDPMLLQQAAYDRYSGTSWRISYSIKFTEIETKIDGLWQIEPSRTPAREAEVSLPLRRGKAVLPLPAGTFQLEGPVGPKVERNIYGAVKVEEGPGLFTYKVRFGEDNGLRGLEDEKTELPVLNNNEAETINRYASELGLLDGSLSMAEKIQRVERFFRGDFTYSLDLRRYDTGTTPLTDFLDNVRSGHCEYYATATTLLLQSAGIPARYTVGFAAEEYSTLEEAYIVRRRHAHAWVTAYVNGQWRVVDATPATWAAYEAEAAASWWQPVSDAASWLIHQFDLWRWSEEEESNSDALMLWLLVPLIIALIWRLSRQKRVGSEDELELMPEDVLYPGMDSAFYRILQQLKKSEFEQREGEPLGWWLSRLETESANIDKLPVEQLRRLLTLHNRYRFDPKGIDASEQAELRQTVEACLAALDFEHTGAVQQTS
ncbi:MAG: transglutaminase domain-containing protein [Pseudomonadota bacterium]